MLNLIGPAAMIPVLLSAASAAGPGGAAGLACDPRNQEAVQQKIESVRRELQKNPALGQVTMDFHPCGTDARVKADLPEGCAIIASNGTTSTRCPAGGGAPADDKTLKDAVHDTLKDARLGDASGQDAALLRQNGFPTKGVVIGPGTAKTVAQEAVDRDATAMQMVGAVAKEPKTLVMTKDTIAGLNQDYNGHGLIPMDLQTLDERRVQTLETVFSRDRKGRGTVTAIYSASDFAFHNAERGQDVAVSGNTVTYTIDQAGNVRLPRGNVTVLLPNNGGFQVTGFHVDSGGSLYADGKYYANRSFPLSIPWHKKTPAYPISVRR